MLKRWGFIYTYRPCYRFLYSLKWVPCSAVVLFTFNTSDQNCRITSFYRQIWHPDQPMSLIVWGTLMVRGKEPQWPVGRLLCIFLICQLFILISLIEWKVRQSQWLIQRSVHQPIVWHFFRKIARQWKKLDRGMHALEPPSHANESIFLCWKW